MTFYQQPVQEVIRQLSSDEQKGLTDAQVEAARHQYGENHLREKKKKTKLLRFADQFRDVMILILLAAAFVSFAIAFMEGNPKEFFEPLLILLIVLLNAIMGVLQESKAEKALDALKNLSAPHARIIRNQKEDLIDAKELVPGDIIRLEAGDFVPADTDICRPIFHIGWYIRPLSQKKLQFQFFIDENQLAG